MGTPRILGEMRAFRNELLAQRDHIEQEKEKLLRQALTGAIETKLMYLDFLRSIPADKREEIGIVDGLVRFSVGIEDAEDLVADIEQALE